MMCGKENLIHKNWLKWEDEPTIDVYNLFKRTEEAFICTSSWMLVIIWTARFVNFQKVDKSNDSPLRYRFLYQLLHCLLHHLLLRLPVISTKEKSHQNVFVISQEKSHSRLFKFHSYMNPTSFWDGAKIIIEVKQPLMRFLLRYNDVFINYWFWIGEISKKTYPFIKRTYCDEISPFISIQSNRPWFANFLEVG